FKLKLHLSTVTKRQFPMAYLVPIEGKQGSWLDAAFVNFRSVQLEIMLVLGQQLVGIGLVHALSSRGIFLFRSFLHQGPDESSDEAEVDGQCFWICAQALGQDDNKE